MKTNNIKSRLLSLNRLSRYISYRAMIGASRAELKMEIVREINHGRLLVVASHPDDEAFGCGGLLLKHRLIGSKIRLVYLSDGEKGNGGPANKELSRRRREEAGRVVSLLEAESVFLGLKDGEIEATEVANLIQNQIKEFGPELILLPCEFDDHPDHREATLGVKKALSNIKKQTGHSLKINIMFYEVWTPLYPNRIVPIDAGAKQKLISNYQSQLEIRSYDRAILGLNDYRGYISGAGGPAEAFFAMPADLWLKLKYRGS